MFVFVAGLQRSESINVVFDFKTSTASTSLLSHTVFIYTTHDVIVYVYKRRSLKNYYVLLNVRMQSASSQLSAQHGRSQNSKKFHDGEESFTPICVGPF